MQYSFKVHDIYITCTYTDWANFILHNRIEYLHALHLIIETVCRQHIYLVYYTRENVIYDILDMIRVDYKIVCDIR